MQPRVAQAPVEAASGTLGAREATLLAGACAALLALAVDAGAGVPYLPTNDGPRHLFAIAASQQLDDPARGWGRYFSAQTPVTSHGFGVLFGPLSQLLAWQDALRLSLALMLALWVGGALAFVWALHPARAWLGLALGAAAFQWTLYMGFFSYYIASAFGLWILAFALRSTASQSRGPSRLALALLAALLFVQALLHVVAAALVGWVLACLLVGTSAQRPGLARAARAALVGLPAALVAGVVLFGGGPAPAAPELPPGPQPTPWWAFGRCFMGGPPWRAWPLTLSAVLALVLAPFSGRSVDRALWGAGGGLALLAGTLPLHIPSWHFVSVRLLPIAVCVSVALLPLERLRRPSLARGVSVAALLFAVSSTAWAHRYNRELAARSTDALSGLSQDVARDGPRLPINLDPALGRPPSLHGPVPYAVPLANLGHLYALDQGGTPPHNFAVNPITHHLRYHADAYRRYPAIPEDLYDWAHRVHDASDPNLRAAILTDAARYGAFYQDVVLWGMPADVDLLAHRGYAIDWRQGGLALARFEGCPLRLEIQGAPPLAPDASLEVGWYPLDATARRIRLRDRALRRGGVLRLELSRMPCGALWLRVRSGGTGGPEDGIVHCEGGDDRGRLVVHSARATPRVRCRTRSHGFARDATRPPRWWGDSPGAVANSRSTREMRKM